MKRNNYILMRYLQQNSFIVCFDVEGPPSFSPFLLKKVYHGDTSVRFEHIQGALFDRFGTSWKSIQV